EPAPAAHERLEDDRVAEALAQTQGGLGGERYPRPRRGHSRRAEGRAGGELVAAGRDHGGTVHGDPPARLEDPGQRQAARLRDAAPQHDGPLGPVLRQVERQVGRVLGADRQPLACERSEEHPLLGPETVVDHDDLVRHARGATTARPGGAGERHSPQSSSSCGAGSNLSGSSPTTSSSTPSSVTNSSPSMTSWGFSRTRPCSVSIVSMARSSSSRGSDGTAADCRARRLAGTCDQRHGPLRRRARLATRTSLAFVSKVTGPAARPRPRTSGSLGEGWQGCQAHAASRWRRYELVVMSARRWPVGSTGPRSLGAAKRRPLPGQTFESKAHPSAAMPVTPWPRAAAVSPAPFPYAVGEDTAERGRGAEARTRRARRTPTGSRAVDAHDASSAGPPEGGPTPAEPSRTGEGRLGAHGAQAGVVRRPPGPRGAVRRRGAG